MTTLPDNDLPAAVPGNALRANCWPAIPDEAGARVLAMSYLLEQMQCGRRACAKTSSGNWRCLRFPSFGEALFPRIAPVQQFQVVQTRLDAIEVHLVVARALTADEERSCARTCSSISSIRSPFRSATSAGFRARRAASTRIFAARSCRPRESMR